MAWSFRRKNVDEERDGNPLSFDAWASLLNQFQYQGLNYSYGSSPQEEISGDLRSVSQLAYKQNGVVFACMLVRMQLFSEARFQFRRIRNGRPGDLFGTAALAPLENPWPGGTTGDLLSKMLQYADLSGNSYAARSRNRIGGIDLLRPDWVRIIAASVNDPGASLWDPDAEVIGYMYQPGGPGSGEDPVFYLAEEVAHFAPIPDPEARFRGMSWITPIIREVMADKAATDHKLKFFENGATPQMVVELEVPDLEKFSKWIEKFKENHEGAANAYKTLYLGAGAKATVVGADLKQLDFKVTQGAGETRIAAAAGVPPVIVGLSEGLQAATYSNYGQARRRLSDGTMWPLWRNAAASLARIINVPSDAELWIDGSHIPFLREDSKDVADIKVQQSIAIKALVEAGFEPDSAVEAITSDDLTQLSHTGMTSVQLLPPGTQKNPDPAPTPAVNGANSERDDRQEALIRGLLEAMSTRQPLTIEAAPTPDVNVTVESPPPAEVNVRVEAAPTPDVNVTVEAAPPAAPAEVSVTVEPPPPAEVNVRVDSPPPAEVSVTVEAAPAPPPAEVNVTVEPPPPADVNVKVDAPPPAEVNVSVQPELRAELVIDADTAEALRSQPGVTVNVEPTPVTVENTVNVDPTPVQVNIDSESSDAEVTFRRNPDGTIKSAKITEAQDVGE